MEEIDGIGVRWNPDLLDFQREPRVRDGVKA
jgi:hypothetical protein